MITEPTIVVIEGARVGIEREITRMITVIERGGNGGIYALSGYHEGNGSVEDWYVHMGASENGIGVGLWPKYFRSVHKCRISIEGKKT